MQTVRKLRKRSGFTLVELLIVIIIIGILAGAMMLIAGSGSDRAEATKIISDLRSMKAAALMYFADEGDVAPSKPGLQKYMDRTLGASYDITGAAGGNWHVFRSGIVATSGISEALAKNAAASGLLGSTVSTDTYEKGDTSVYMLAR